MCKLCKFLPRLGLVLAIVCLGVSGCAGNRKPPAIPVKGKVMYRKTTPPVGALVVFHPASVDREKEIGGKPFGKVGEDGSFTLTTYQEGDGAPAGDYNVTIDWRSKTKESKFAFGEGGGGGVSMLNPRYSDPSKPAFKVSVKQGEANEFTFEVD